MLNVPWGNVYGGYRDRNEQVEDRRNVQRKANIDSMAAMQQIIAQSPGITPEQAAGLYRQMNPGAPSDWIADFVTRQNQEYTNKQQLQQRQEQRQVRTSRLANMTAMQQLIANSPGITPEQGIELWKQMDPNAPGEWVANYVQRQNQQHAVKQQQNQLAMRGQELQYMGQVDAMRDRLIMQLGNDASPQQLGQALVGQLGQGSEQYVQRSLSGVQNLGQHRQILMTKALAGQMDTIKSLPVAARGDYLRQQFPGFGDELAQQYEADARYEILDGIAKQPQVFSRMNDDALIDRANREAERRGMTADFTVDEINQHLGAPAYREAAYEEQDKEYRKQLRNRRDELVTLFEDRRGRKADRLKTNAQVALGKDSPAAAAALNLGRSYLLEDATMDFILQFMKENEDEFSDMMPSDIESAALNAASEAGLGQGVVDMTTFIATHQEDMPRAPLPDFDSRFKEYDHDLTTSLTPESLTKAFVSRKGHVATGPYDPATEKGRASAQAMVENRFKSQKQRVIDRLDEHIEEVEEAIKRPRYFGMYGGEEKQLGEYLTRLYKQKELIRQTPTPEYEIESTLLDKDPTDYRSPYPTLLPP